MRQRFLASQVPYTVLWRHRSSAILFDLSGSRDNARAEALALRSAITTVRYLG